MNSEEKKIGKEEIKKEEPKDKEKIERNIKSEDKKEGEEEKKIKHEIVLYSKFDEMKLKDDLLRGIYGYGFEKPSLIQQQSVVPLINGVDTIAQAQSGTGKTGAFAVGVLQRVNTENQNVQALILSPTRELAQQTERVIKCLGEHLKLKIYCCVGGTYVTKDKVNLKEGIHVVVGTPGRIYDLIKKEYLITDFLKILILDEADEMLGRGFLSQINDIFQRIPGDVQVGLFSATMPEDIIKITEKFMRNPISIQVPNEEVSLKGIKQYYIALNEEGIKFDTLTELFRNMDIQQCMIYCNTKQKVDLLTNKMTENKFVVSSIHGDMDPDKREVVMKEFRTGTSRVLISTDLTARGIDIQQVNLVINYDLPSVKEKYIHRIGRSGRFGRKGVAINFVTPTDSKFLKEVEEEYKIKIEKLPYDLTDIL